MVRLQQTKTGQYVLTIPQERVAELGWSKGDVISMNFDRRTGELILTKIKQNI
jgi:bifunctional DNA-binding transcriptional regulator/antitoxin component of YhaV-PrlF toxin-antitoxin module